MNDFFISYSHLDRPLVDDLDRQLKDRKRSAWWDRELSALTGTSSLWRDEVATAICASRAVIVLVTSNSAPRQELKREVQFAEEQKVKLIPVFVGEPTAPPERRGLLLQFAGRQRIENRSLNHIDSATVDACIRALEHAVAQPRSHGVQDSTPPHDLRPLTREDVIKSLPTLDWSQRALYRACRRHLIESATDKNWDEVNQLLKDIPEWKIVGLVARLTELNEWRRAVAAFDQAVEKTRTWGDLVVALAQAGDGTPLRLPSVLAEHLATDWWRAVNESIERLRNAIEFGPKHGSYEHALESLALLKPEVTHVVATMIGESGRLIEDVNLVEAAKEMLRDLGAPADRDVRDPVDELRAMAWPPSDVEIDAFESALEAQRHRQAGVVEWLRFLHDAARLCGGSDTAAARLAVLLNSCGLSATGDSGLNTDAIRACAAEWRTGLEARLRGSDALAVQALDRAAAFFSTAARHAALIRASIDANAELTGFLDQLENTEWPIPANAFRRMRKAAESLQATLNATPPPPDRNRWRQFEERLQNSVREKARQIALFECLNLLATDTPRGAVVLAEFAAGAATGESAAWAAIATALAEDPLRLELGRLETDAGVRLLALLTMPERSFAALRDQAVRAHETLRGALASHSQLRRFRVPRLDQLLSDLPNGAECRQLADAVRVNLVALDLEAAVRDLTTLSTKVPVARVQEIAAAVRAIAATLASARRASSERRWEEAIHLLDAAPSEERLGADLDDGWGAVSGKPLTALANEALVQERAQYESAIRAEEALSNGLDLLGRGKYADAVTMFEELASQRNVPDVIVRDIALARIAATHLGALSELLKAAGSQSVTVDRATGLPPDQSTIDHERARQQRVIAAAEAAGKAIHDLNTVRDGTQVAGPELQA
jgi:hypothetical protein